MSAAGSPLQRVWALNELEPKCLTAMGNKKKKTMNQDQGFYLDGGTEHHGPAHPFIGMLLLFFFFDFTGL